MSVHVLCLQTIGERETETRSAQDQASHVQGELTRLRQELVEKAAQEDRHRQQTTEKEERTRKTILLARGKINHLMGKNFKAVFLHMSKSFFFSFFFNKTLTVHVNS